MSLRQRVDVFIWPELAFAALSQLRNVYLDASRSLNFGRQTCSSHGFSCGNICALTAEDTFSLCIFLV